MLAHEPKIATHEFDGKRCLVTGGTRVSAKLLRQRYSCCTVSPGWVETEAAVGLVNELAASKGSDYESARQALMDSSCLKPGC